MELDEVETPSEISTLPERLIFSVEKISRTKMIKKKTNNSRTKLENITSIVKRAKKPKKANCIIPNKKNQKKQNLPNTNKSIQKEEQILNYISEMKNEINNFSKKFEQLVDMVHTCILDKNKKKEDSNNQNNNERNKKKCKTERKKCKNAKVREPKNHIIYISDSKSSSPSIKSTKKKGARQKKKEDSNIINTINTSINTNYNTNINTNNFLYCSPPHPKKQKKNNKNKNLISKKRKNNDIFMTPQLMPIKNINENSFSSLNFENIKKQINNY